MSVKELFNQFHDIASDPKKQMDRYLAEGRKVVLTAPVYTPEELVHSMGMVPMGVWGADVELKEAKRYFPAFICSIVQSIVEMGMKGAYEGASALIVPSLCDSLKVLGENWKYAVPSIPFIPMTYPQNRKPAYGIAYTKAGYERVIRDLEKATGAQFSEEALQESLGVYNEHNEAMRRLTAVLADHPEVSAVQRNDVFKSAWFLRKEEHTQLVKELIQALEAEQPGAAKKRIMTTGVLTDSPELLKIFDENGLQIVCDDVAAESRQYRTDNEKAASALDSLAEKFANMDNCSVLYDRDKKRVAMIVDQAKAAKADGVILIMTKFCDPEEYDVPILMEAFKEAGIPLLVVEIDQQTRAYEQIMTRIQSFAETL